MSSVFSLNNGYVYLGGDSFSKSNVLVRGGVIAEISSSVFSLGEEIDCRGLWILPGAIDPHVHFRVPGGEFKEDWEHGSRAAVSSGVTSVIDMPNTEPPTTTLASLREKRQIAARDSLVNFGFHFGLSLDNLDELDSVSNIAGLKVYFGSSTGSLLVSDESYLGLVMSKLEGRSIPIAFHAEDEEILRANSLRYGSYEGDIGVLEFHNMLRSEDCAFSAVKKIIDMARPYRGLRLYFCHISTIEEFNFLKDASEFMDISIELTPHHIFLSLASMGSSSYLGKVNPPLRSEFQRLSLYRALLDGRVDVVATDHAPHLEEEKLRSYVDSPSGMPGLESFVPLLLNELCLGNISVESFVNLTGRNAAGIFSVVNKGFIRKGFDADIMIVNPSMDHVIGEGSIFTKSGWNPFRGRSLLGRVVKTIVGASLVYSFGGGFFYGSRGRELCFL